MGAVQRFGNAELDVEAVELRIDAKRVPLGPRGVNLLAVLIEHRGRPVSKRELLDTVWRGVIVEENNLQVQISTLRRLLGPDAIATIPGRGYRFVLPIEGEAALLAAEEDPTRPLPLERGPSRGNLPERLPEMYGRDTDATALRALAEIHPLVSIAGAAGIGKTRLALEVARAFSPKMADGVWLVELAAVNDPRLLVPTIAQALGITLPGLRHSEDELVAALRDQRALLLIDNCEQLIDEIGRLLARLVASASNLHILATSQEPLRVDGERRYRLGPLAVPDGNAFGDPTAFGAVRLFVERVRSLMPEFRLGASDATAAVEICRRLDGLPLAIELAAARVPVLGVAGVRDRLGERFRILTGGSRVAPKRHQTLRAALDWSLALLDDDERAIYRRLGVFVGGFALESAQELAADADIGPWDVLEHLSSLIDKSLVVAEGKAVPRYRMLESTREHALEQLALAGETDAWIARHASTTLHALKRAIRDRRSDLVLAETANLRSAYDWARAAGDNAAAVALVTLPSMAIAVEGGADESRRLLLEVEPLVADPSLPPFLVAQYWQWQGRVGVDGRLPSARCIAAFRRAEEMFIALGNLRHVHACRRQLAEAMLDAGDVDGAAEALQRARELEGEAWPLADRMRRMRVEGLWHAESGRSAEALETATRALQQAQLASIGRYELVLLDDIARFHLEAGHADEAAERYRVLVNRARRASGGGLTLANALAGLVAALTAKNDLEAARRIVQEALPLLRRSGTLLVRADILACLVAREERFELSAHLLGASDKFRADSAIPRGPVEQRCRDDAVLRLSSGVSARRRAAWLAEGAGRDEDALVAALEAEFASEGGAEH